MRPTSVHELKRTDISLSHHWWEQIRPALHKEQYDLFIVVGDTSGKPSLGEERIDDPTCCRIDPYPPRRYMDIMTSRGRPVQQIDTGRWMWIEAVMFGSDSDDEGRQFLNVLEELSRLRHGGDSRNHCLAPEHFLRCETPNGELVMFAVFPALDPAYPLTWDTVDNAYKACAQLAETVAYLHEQGLSHRDIRSDNILANLNGVNHGPWDPNSDLYLIDWEYASALPLETGPPCSDYYAPCGPEVNQREPHNPQLADVWQLGLVFQEGLSTLSCPPEEYLGLLALCKDMTRDDPGRRPTAQQVANTIRSLQACPAQRGQFTSSQNQSFMSAVLAVVAVVLLCICVERWCH
ncbi:hypothetical protein CALVIDRAFT_542673 [Calocera viscosa TUFC12733]|uniref:Protein kinase domain-containing protein n=1 Tax=Calocera viscosa (strain TUFC12733) TaxID=1330018 RepID=A0A167GEN0_CALVF|nr:hypothetical protein CALVIDRAFT_542673 [Calocera viscosa TUFC12733]